MNFLDPSNFLDPNWVNQPIKAFESIFKFLFDNPIVGVIPGVLLVLFFYLIFKVRMEVRRYG